MITRGSLAVVGVRSDCLIDALYSAIYRSRDRRRQTNYPDRIRAAYLAGEAIADAHWHAQRLASACDHALGTRDR